MKTITSLAAMLLLCAIQGIAQDIKEKVKKEFAMSKGYLEVKNINGFVAVEGYDGNSILIAVDQIFSGKNAEESKKDVSVEFEQLGDSLFVWIKTPCRTERKSRNKGHCEERKSQNFTFNYTIKVPSNVRLNISTINDGDISIKNVKGGVTAKHINGSILAENIKGESKLRTINGDIKGQFSETPDDKSTFNTINGKIDIAMPASLSADLKFKSLNGEIYTDYEYTQIAKNTNSEKSKEGMKVYKSERANNVRVGSGGPSFNFETLNGNIYIRKQK